MLSPAKKNEMPTNWSFNWLNLWQNTDFECQNIVKLVYKGKVWGLVRYGLYPYPGSPKFLEIEQIEAHPTSRGEGAERFMEPIGKWLIWYASKVGLELCQTETDKPLVVLVALDTAVSIVIRCRWSIWGLSQSLREKMDMLLDSCGKQPHPSVINKKA
ncbi:hypothetical protein [Nostoc sp.]|uniref:hypothetical protein n=1 Tax=Nostoc sp. TaxID=1180 RepID=UPI002FF887F1